MDLNKLTGSKSLDYFTGGQAEIQQSSRPVKKPVIDPKPVNGTYTVKAGDTLSAIATKQGTTISTLQKLNGIKDADVIQVGQKIKLSGTASEGKPSTEYHTVKSGDTVSALAKKYKTTQKQIKLWNKLTNINKIYVGQSLRVK